MFAPLPPTPYVAVLFTSVQTGADTGGYAAMAERMDRLAAEQPGYLGIESVHDANGFGITISYWATEADAAAWKQVADHLGAQQMGREQWYQRYIVRVASVTRQYDWQRAD